MAFIQVIGMFDDRAALEDAKSALADAGLANEGTVRVEPEHLIEDLHPPRKRTIWERLKDLLPGESDEIRGVYAEGITRGAWLLVVTVREEDAERVKEIMRENGAVELRRRVRRWLGEGWTGFDPAGLAFTEQEVVEERRRCLTEQEIAAADTAGGDGQERPIRLFDEATGREIGRISEGELAVLQAAFEEEDPDDNDYWINGDEIDDLACRPGATPHLIRLLKGAVGDNPDGIDIAYQREGEPVRGMRAAKESAT